MKFEIGQYVRFIIDGNIDSHLIPERDDIVPQVRRIQDISYSKSGSLLLNLDIPDMFGYDRLIVADDFIEILDIDDVQYKLMMT